MDTSLAVFNRQDRKAARRIGAGVDVDPIVVNFRLPYRRMPVNNHFPEILLTIEERVPDPHQIISALAVERHSRLYSCMREKKVATTVC